MLGGKFKFLAFFANSEELSTFSSPPIDHNISTFNSSQTDCSGVFERQRSPPFAKYVGL